MSIHKIASELQEAALLENTEMGDYLEALVNISKYAFEHSSEEFAGAIEQELTRMHAWVFGHYEIVEVTETRTETRKELRMKEEE
jgi:hypothetical protein